MPLLDHFHPPLSQRRHWDSFHGAWAEAIALQLNESLLPPHYVAEARVQLGGHVEIDVATFEEPGEPTAATGGIAVWAPPKPTMVVPLNMESMSSFEVLITNDEEGPTLVAAVELVSPANKDRPAHRRQFATKCAAYLFAQAGVLVVDVVTSRGGNLHQALLDVLDVKASGPGRGHQELFAAAYRTCPRKESLDLEIWTEPLSVGTHLPTMPLWIHPTICLPLDLEDCYQAACSARRIPGA